MTIVVLFFIVFGLIPLFASSYLFYRNEKTYNYLQYINKLIYLNNILNIALEKKVYDVDISPSYSTVLLSIKPFSRHFRKPFGFKMFSDFTDADLNLILEATSYSDHISAPTRKSIKYVEEYETIQTGHRE